MLVHKTTMSIISEIYTGTTVGNNPVYKKNLKLEDYPDLDPSEWWEINDGTLLARKLSRNYPNVTPIVDACGQLVGVNIVKTQEQLEYERQEIELNKERIDNHRKETGNKFKNLISSADVNDDSPFNSFIMESVAESTDANYVSRTVNRKVKVNKTKKPNMKHMMRVLRDSK